MKFDSYTRFLKSQLYQECILAEVEGRSLPDAQQVPSSPASKHSVSSEHSSVSTPKKVPELQPHPLSRGELLCGADAARTQPSWDVALLGCTLCLQLGGGWWQSCPVAAGGSVPSHRQLYSSPQLPFMLHVTLK